MSHTVADRHSDEYRNLSCEERVDTELREEIKTLRKLWESYEAGEEEDAEEGSFYDHGLAFDYVPAGTFDGQREGYFRYQISWGGPGDEFRFYVNPDFTPHRVEYWFLDWFDGACRVLQGDEERLLMEIFAWFFDIGSVHHVFAEAQE